MNAYYRLYIKSIIKLAATLLIKDEYTARSINEYLKIQGYAVDDNDPYSWKYYLNMAGEYHASDTLMQVTSVDSREIINFTKENLEIHRGTREEYGYGSRYYKDLVQRYPKQQSLINGILNPIDQDTAIASEDHKILFYDTDLVEPRERHLIPGLQRYIDLFFNRWNNQDYALFEPYYYPGLLGVLYTKLPLEILLLRKNACKTDMAHSYHIRQYLSSFSQVGAEFDYMADKQRLWLYRNIRYLNLNLGREEVFKEITKRILTDRGFSLVGYELKHDYTDLTENLSPSIEAHRVILNGIAPAQGGSTKTVTELLELEQGVARDNYIYQDDTAVEATETMKKSLFNDLKTKVLESNVLDRTDSEPYTLTDTLLNHWIYFSHIGLYTSSISFTNPRNGDVYRLNAKDAFIFYLYVYNRAIGISITTIPAVTANRVRRHTPPTFAELRALSTTDKVSDEQINYIINSQVSLDRYVSIESFKEACQAIQKVMLEHRTYRHMLGDYRADGQMHTLIDRCYADFGIDLGNDVDYSTWLNAMGLDIEELESEEYRLLAEDIFRSATGADINFVQDVKSIHASMIRIMRALSSYNVQYLAEINNSPLIVTAGKFPKQGIPEFDSTAIIDVESPLPIPLDQSTSERSLRPAGVLVGIFDVMASEDRIEQHVKVDVGIQLITPVDSVMTVDLQAPVVALRSPEITELPETGSALPLNKYADLVGTDYVKDDSVFESGLVSIAGYGGLSESRRLQFLGI